MTIFPVTYLTEPEITVHICVWPCASIPCKLDFFSFLVLASDVKDTNAQQRATEKTAVHVGFVNFFCMADVHGDT